ncbi:MAG: CAP domain-containing protein [Candidatus Paceibacterota bacterium]
MQEPKKPLHHHLLDYFLPHERNNYHPNLFSAVSIAALVFAVIIFEGAYLVQTKYVFLKTDFLASVLPGALVALTNQDRAIQGLAGVTQDALLDKAAQAAAEDMAANGYFAHVSPDGKDPWYWLNQAGYKYSYAGENLAVNFTDSENVQSAWMESPTHRANIVKREYTQVGFGTANGMYEGQETTFVVSFFAAPAVVEVAVSAPENIAIAEIPVAEATTTSTSTVQVLGTQTVVADNSGAAAAAAPVPATPSWLARLLASPLHTLWAIFTVLFAIIATALAITILVRVKVQHPRILIGGTMLLVLIGTSMLLSAELAGPVHLLPDTQPAAVGAALPN